MCQRCCLVLPGCNISTVDNTYKGSSERLNVSAWLDSDTFVERDNRAEQHLCCVDSVQFRERSHTFGHCRSESGRHSQSANRKRPGVGDRLRAAFVAKTVSTSSLPIECCDSSGNPAAASFIKSCTGGAADTARSSVNSIRASCIYR